VLAQLTAWGISVLQVVKLAIVVFYFASSTTTASSVVMRRLRCVMHSSSVCEAKSGLSMLRLSNTLSPPHL
jgi:hypothetical protein